ncbi:MAG: alkaline phosphatase family protein [Candidatus Dormibacteria bacterium]
MSRDSVGRAALWRSSELLWTRHRLQRLAGLGLAFLLLGGLSGCGTPPPARHARVRQTASPTLSPSPSPTGAAAQLPHILVIVDENRGYAATQTDCGSDNSYFCQLAAEYASVAPWYGVTHPSQPNYLALISGSTQGCTSDGCSGPYGGANLGWQLTQADIPWAAYMESMPSPCYQGDSAGEYARKHDPFVVFQDLQGSACSDHVLPYPGASGLVRALEGPAAPDFVWITPNLLDDMHDGSVAEGNAWLAANLGPVLNSTWFTQFPGTVIVTEDENDAEPGGGCCGEAQGGQVPQLVISQRARGKGAVAATGDHYGTLRTIEEAYNLPLLGGAAQAANGDLTSLFG